MKRTELLKKFFRKGWRVLREGGSHTIMTDGTDTEAVPRHKEVSEQLARAIIKRRKLDD